ncbi:MAG: tRNA pseudouridine(13) synthase TruD [Nanoarchaeota archaeon]
MQGTIKQNISDFIVRELLPDGFIQDTGTYRVLSLTKEGINTEDALQKLARQLGTPRKAIGYCGNKDKHARTTQYLTIRCDQLNLKKLASADIMNCLIAAVGYSDAALTLGQNLGNAFTITVRNLPENASPKTTGSIPNYFDEQRFSKTNVDVGRAIIHREFNEACKLAFPDQPIQNSIARLRTLPMQDLLLYIHAYQGFLWNETVYRYLKNKKGHDVAYSKGLLRFPKEPIPDENIPLIGFMHEPSDIKKKKVREISTTLMDEENITTRSFIIREIPYLTSEGGERTLLIKLQDFHMQTAEDDELFPGRKKIQLTFSLPSGSYATMVIKALFTE